MSDLQWKIKLGSRLVLNKSFVDEINHGALQDCDVMVLPLEYLPLADDSLGFKSVAGH